MKKTVFLLLFILCSMFAGAQQIEVETTIKEGCNLLYGLYGKDFTKYKKVKKNTPIVILGRSQKFKNFYLVRWNEETYNVNGMYVNDSGLAEYARLEKEQADLEKERADANKAKIEAEKKSKEEEVRKEKHKKDSLLEDRDRRIAAIREDRKNKRIKLIDSLDAVKAQLEDSLFKAGYPIQIYVCSISDPNSAGGVDLMFNFNNMSKTTIKYIHISGYIVNDVNDKAYCTIRRYSNVTMTGVGPVESKETGVYNWENTWYNNTASTYIPTQIKIEYMNGSTTIVNQEKIKRILALPSMYDKIKAEIDKFDNVVYRNNIIF